jgi:redox-sensitive bicupin YhaK (pirin superfamily)
MITLKRSEERGFADHGWLVARHSFSFADYFDPSNMNFRSLRVINEDRVAPGHGFPMHGHRDMEILTYVYEGALEHKDSMGNGSTIRPGDVQYMSAGSGVLHSEFNPSKEDPTRLLQIWIQPSEKNAAPRYGQQNFAERRDRLRLVASHDGAEASIAIRQDVRVYASVLSEGRTLEHSIAAGRHAWTQLVRGELDVNGKTLKAGDAAIVSDESRLELRSRSGDAEFLLFDLS